MTRRFAAALLAAALAELSIALPARAALCLCWEAGPPASPGDRVVVAFRTLIPLASGELKPHPTPDYPFRVEAVSPGGDAHEIRVAPTADPHVWLGSFVAARAGEWTVRVANFEQGAVDPSCYQPLVLEVTESSAGWGWWPWAAIGSSAILVGAIALRRSHVGRTL